MRRILACCVCGISAWIILVSFAYAQEVSSTELINNARQYDGKLVVYRGEAVGDIMARGDNAWVNLNDGYTAIGVWARKTELQDIGYVGSYRARGDILEVLGVLNRSCPEHGGDLDIHAWEIKIIQPGESSFRQLSMKKVYTAICLISAVLILYAINSIFRGKRRKR